MNSVVVASRSFSKHPVLRKELIDRYPDARFNDTGVSLEGKALVEILKGAPMAITALEKIDQQLLSQLPELKVISKYGVGLDMIDFHAMKKHGVKLGWSGGVNKRSVSELVVSSAVSLLHRAVMANNEVKRGKWYQVKGRMLSGCTVGIIGCGHIGKDLVTLLQPFGCRILSHDINNFPEFYAMYNVVPVELDALLRESDLVTLHLPLDKTTRNILNRDRLHMMKHGAVLINYARGGLLDEQVLLEKLQNADFAGAAMDVFSIEPPVNEQFSKMDNVFITPHIGGSTEEAILAMGRAAICGLDSPKDPLEILSVLQGCNLAQ